MAPEKERENRSKGVNFILQVGIMLKLPQITLATASIFLHRFYMRHSMQNSARGPGLHYYSMAATSLFLATKVEENCRKMKELVIACVRVAQKDPQKLVDEQDKEYWRWRDNILQYEDTLLEAICFDLSLEPPYKTLFELLLFFREEHNKRLRNAAWAFVNDSCLTMLCLLFSSRTIATSALYVAAKHCEVAFPDDAQGRPWWDVIGVDLGDIQKACNYMAGIYENVPSKAGNDGGIYGRTPEGGDEWNDKTRVVGVKIDGRRSSRGSLEAPDVSPMASVDGGERHAKREREDAAGEEKALSVINGAGKETNGEALNGEEQGNPRKRQRTNSEAAQHRADEDHPNGLPARPRWITEAARTEGPVLHAERPAEGAQTGGIAGGGLVSPKLNDVSEEGEVEP